MPRRLRFTVALITSILAAFWLVSYAVAQEPAPSPDSTAETTTSEPAAPDPDVAAPPADAETAQEPADDDVELEEDEDALEQDEDAATDEPGDAAQADDEDRSCEDFATQKEAQEYFTDQGGDATHNIDNLDADGDGKACESLNAPAGGVDAGGGGTAPPPTADANSPLPFVFGGALVGLAIGAFLIIGRRRRATG